MNALAYQETANLSTDLLPNTQARSVSAGVILVAVGFGQRSRNALRWGKTLARSLGMKLRLVHAAIERLPVDPLFPLDVFRQARHREAWLDSLHEALRGWALQQGKVQLSADDVRVAYGDVAELILQEATQPDVRLVLFGGLPSEAPLAEADLPRDLLRRCPRPMLFIGPHGLNPVVVAATDCSDPTLPVLTEAWRMAGALGEQILLVHNVDSCASQLAERIGMPLTSEMADNVANQSREWLEERAAVGDVMITREHDNAQGVLTVARDLNADLLVVGVKPAEQAHHGTAERILKEAQRSVLFVPMASPAPSQRVRS